MSQLYPLPFSPREETQQRSTVAVLEKLRPRRSQVPAPGLTVLFLYTTSGAGRRRAGTSIGVVSICRPHWLSLEDERSVLPV